MQLDEVGERLGKGELSFNIDKDVVSVGVQTDEPGELCDDDPDEQVDAGDSIVDQVTNAATKVMEQQGRVTCVIMINTSALMLLRYGVRGDEWTVV